MEELQGPMLSCELCDYVTPRPDILAKHRSHLLVLREGKAAPAHSNDSQAAIDAIKQICHSGSPLLYKENISKDKG